MFWRDSFRRETLFFLGGGGGPKKKKKKVCTSVSIGNQKDESKRDTDSKKFPIFHWVLLSYFCFFAQINSASLHFIYLYIFCFAFSTGVMVKSISTSIPQPGNSNFNRSAR